MVILYIKYPLAGFWIESLCSVVNPESTSPFFEPLTLILSIVPPGEIIVDWVKAVTVKKMDKMIEKYNFFIVLKKRDKKWLCIAKCNWGILILTHG